MKLTAKLITINRKQDKYSALMQNEDIVIDETMVSWRGRLTFRQYILTKSHKYGIKLFKLCSTEGYTWFAKVYSGRDITGSKQVGTAENVCIEFADKLDACRWNCTVQQKNNFIMSYQLKRGKMITREDKNGIVMLKRRDVRDVRILSTKHAPIMISSSNSSYRRRPPKQKPLVVIVYNNGKTSIDRSNQMVSYVTTIRKSIKWYRKLALHLLLGTTMVNAHIVYQTTTNRKIRENFGKFSSPNGPMCPQKILCSTTIGRKRRSCPTIWRFVRISKASL
ncbi:piggyBac transposable element-derived protein 4-like isoform X1 [Bombus huntii]|uniref:piggyBac transposable element-derived protein 4-like isoform X1 n=1 Tax=Bombus huntii TaxID=85661 RepID=UPI0021AA0728|nr:piggyBac transposable element-derived protein 4-like isoform X1 [Bombus huntii]XP_050480260.1 piggyBac transposable element-derived protein 4-like isoform X1 [Bombus huntii]XP_050480261.1 piggyBac transposable element-derived protein 4-like isoform X1 [Bombus huntii]